MSYRFEVLDSSFYIGQGDTHDALEALLDRERQSSYEVPGLLTARTLREAFAALDWKWIEDELANVVGIAYLGPLYGSWTSLAIKAWAFDAIAPYVRPESYIVAHVEDILGLTHGRGYLEERLTFDGAHASVESVPRIPPETPHE
jgi:hypothetical protein